MWKKLFKFVGKQKVVDLDNDGKIESLEKEVAGVFSHFKRMNDQLEDVKYRMEGIISEEEKTKAIADQRIAKAKASLETHNKVQEKLKDFIV